jgi:hypothetical protein
VFRRQVLLVQFGRPAFRQLCSNGGDSFVARDGSDSQLHCRAISDAIRHKDADDLDT